MGPGDEGTRALKLPQLEGKTTPKLPFLRCRGDVTEKRSCCSFCWSQHAENTLGCAREGQGRDGSVPWDDEGQDCTCLPSLLHLPTWKNTGLIKMTAKRRWRRVLVHGRCAVGTTMGMAVLEGWAGWATVWAKGGLGRCGLISLAGWVLIVRNGFYWAWNLD